MTIQKLSMAEEIARKVVIATAESLAGAVIGILVPRIVNLLRPKIDVLFNHAWRNNEASSRSNI